MNNQQTKTFFSKKIFRFFSYWEVQIVVIIGLLVLLGTNLSPYFLDGKNQIRNSKNLIEIALMALPMTFIIITGNIDLSVASNLLMSAVVMAKLFENGTNIWVAVMAGILTGIVGGLINGILIGIVKLPALVATLGTYTLYRGIGYSLLKDFTVKGFPDSFVFIGQKVMPGTTIPAQIFLFLFFLIIFGLVLHGTTLGRYIYSIGQNEDTCRYSGVPVDGVKILIFTLSGMMSAIAGMVLSARYGSVDADIAAGYELTVITAVVLGGVMTSGGTGSMLGVLFSLILVSEVRLLMNLMNIQGSIQQIVFGVLLITAILLPRIFNYLRAQRRMKLINKEIQSK
jgi:rhamnose transport system permease protein